MQDTTVKNKGKCSTQQVILATLTPHGATVTEMRFNVKVEKRLILVVCGKNFCIFLTRNTLKRTVFLTFVICSFQVRELTV